MLSTVIVRNEIIWGIVPFECKQLEKGSCSYFTLTSLETCFFGLNPSLFVQT